MLMSIGVILGFTGISLCISPHYRNKLIKTYYYDCLFNIHIHIHISIFIFVLFTETHYRSPNICNEVN